MTSPYHHVAVDPRPTYLRARQLVRFSYVVLTYFAIVSLRSLPAYDTPPDALLWPIAWTSAVPWSIAIGIIFSMSVVGSLLAAVAPRVVAFRVIAVAGLGMAKAVEYSDFGKINHGYHLWTLVALLLVFLPRGDDRDPGHVRAYLEIAWGAQALILSTYLIAGTQKLIGAWTDWNEDGVTIFTPSSLALHLAKVVVRGEGGGPLADLVLEHPRIFGPLMAVALGVELLAIATVFRPRAQRLWAVLLIGLHIGIGLVMDIWFEPQAFVVGVWLLASPFAPTHQNAWTTLFEVPVVGRSAALGWSVLWSRGHEVAMLVDGRREEGRDVVVRAARSHRPGGSFRVEHRFRRDAVILGDAHARAWVLALHERCTPRLLLLLMLPGPLAEHLMDRPDPVEPGDGARDEARPHAPASQR